MDAVCDINSFSLAGTVGLANPQILVRSFFLQFVEMHIKIVEFVRENIGIRNDIERSMAEFFLHVDDIFTQAVFPRDFVASREVVYFLVFIETLVNVGVGAAIHPKDVPVMGFCTPETI
jgi:hypothetical protein